MTPKSRSKECITPPNNLFEGEAKLNQEEGALRQITFVDIETCVDSSSWHTLSHHYEKKFNHLFPSAEESLIHRSQFIQQHFEDNAALYAEFGKVVSVSVGKMLATKFAVKTFVGLDEELLLKSVNEAVAGCNTRFTCAHNGKDFDFPYLVRRHIILGIQMPKWLDVSNLKPWESPWLDTMDLWAAGQWKYKISLDLLCGLFKLPSPKDEFDGSQVTNFLMEHGYEKWAQKMVEYCGMDNFRMMQCYCRMKGIPTEREVVFTAHIQ